MVMFRRSLIALGVTCERECFEKYIAKFVEGDCYRKTWNFICESGTMVRL